GGGGSSNDTQSQLTPGMLDPSFGSGGKVVTSIAGVGNAVALQSDGKIVVAGGPSVLRFNADGTLDIGFGAAGMAVSANFGAFSVALQPDGKIVAAGNFVDSSKGGFISCALIRYTSNGAIDASFGAGGIVIGNPLGNDVSACTGGRRAVRWQDRGGGPQWWRSFGHGWDREV